MTSRGNDYNPSNDWDPMQEDFDNTTYDAQYHCEESSRGVNLDHCRLYIKNIPMGLNKDGLTAVFAKFGKLVESFMSTDPNKRYGLVSYETPGEARIAMMKLNNSGPLNLNIAVAHKAKARDNQQRNNQQRDHHHNNNNSRQRINREYGITNSTYYRDNATTSSHGSNANARKQDESMNRADMTMDKQMVDEMDLESLDSDLHEQIDQLRLEELTIQEKKLQMMRKMLLNEAERKRSSNHMVGINRSVMPDGRIVVRNAEMSSESRDTDGGFGAGGGDSLNIPALQRFAPRRCVACAAPADSFCSRCGATPYCSQRCQQRDWISRHKEVCHNLARVADPHQGEHDATANIDPVLPPAAPLRRPYSPKRDHVKTDDGTPVSQNMKFPLAGHSGISSRPNNNKSRNNADNLNNSFNNTSGDRRGVRQTEDKSGRFKSPSQKPKQEISQPAIPKMSENPEPNVEKPVEKPVEKVKQTLPQVQKVQVTSTGKPTASFVDVTPSRELVPKNYMIETLSIGDKVLLSVDQKASDCGMKSKGFVCLSLHESVEAAYQMLCEDYVLDCEADTQEYTPSPGKPFSYFNPEDGAWYRARCLSATTAALIDSGKLITLSKGDKCKKLTQKYQSIPEFCCLLQADVKIGDNLVATLESKEGASYKVSLENVDDGASCGAGVIARWIPQVEIPARQPAAVTTSAPVGSAVPKPTVTRPDIVSSSKVFLVDATDAETAFVRPSDDTSQRAYDDTLYNVLMLADSAVPMEKPPTPGETVIARFNDGVHYRAVVIRRNIKMNKYLVENIELGIQQICKLEDIYACPSSMDIHACPTLVSRVQLEGINNAFSKQATDYVDKLKNDCIELILTIPSGDKSLPSGASVILTKQHNKECVNNQINSLSTPEWKKMEERGGDVLEVKPLMLSDLEFLTLPEKGCTLDILDVSSIASGSVGGCEAGLKHIDFIAGKLSQQMEAYCNSKLGREPYLPNVEELCIAQCPPYPQWFRAVVCEQVSGAGGSTAFVLYVDYGNMQRVACSSLRKMLPEFVRGVPALASLIEIEDFPEKPSEEMQLRALTHMKINDEGRGVLRVTRCTKQEDGSFLVRAPELIAAMNNA